jgi:hypothetical protein
MMLCGYSEPRDVLGMPPPALHMLEPGEPVHPAASKLRKPFELTCTEVKLCP